MEQIASFTIDHCVLEPGIYISRTDRFDGTALATYDLRMTRPNREPVLSTGAIHTIEHLAATWLRNDPNLGSSIVYFGPMGCRTGCYLILAGQHDQETVFSLVLGVFKKIATYEGPVFGASAKECGNYLDHDLPGAKHAASQYVERLTALAQHDFAYPGAQPTGI